MQFRSRESISRPGVDLYLRVRRFPRRHCGGYSTVSVGAACHLSGLESLYIHEEGRVLYVPGPVGFRPWLAPFALSRGLICRS